MNIKMITKKMKIINPEDLKICHIKNRNSIPNPTQKLHYCKTLTILIGTKIIPKKKLNIITRMRS